MKKKAMTVLESHLTLLHMQEVFQGKQLLIEEEGEAMIEGVVVLEDMVVLEDVVVLGDTAVVLDQGIKLLPQRAIIIRILATNSQHLQQYANPVFILLFP